MSEVEGVSYVSAIINREIKSVSEILMGEASNVITALKTVAQAPEDPF
jgi:hypothetical protein